MATFREQSAHMFRRALRARARILRDRAQAIREGR